MFFLFFILGICFLIVLLIVFTTIKVHIKNLKFSTDKINGRNLNSDYRIILSLYIFGKIKYFNLDITKFKLENQKIRRNISKVQEKVLSNKNEIDINIFKLIKKINLKIEKLRLNINLGTEDAALTAETVGAISGILSIIIGLIAKNKNQNNWRVNPIYNGRNFFNIDLNCIFEIKLIHIISTLYILSRKEKVEK